MKNITRCHSCFGSGSRNENTCATCHGDGWYFSDTKSNFWTMNVSEEEATKYAKETAESCRSNINPQNFAVLDEYASMIEYYREMDYAHNEMLCSKG